MSILEGINESYLSNIAKNTSEIEEMKEMAVHPSFSVRTILARNPKITTTIIRQLIDHNNCTITCALISNPRFNNADLQYILHSNKENSIKAIFSTPAISFTDDVYEAVLNHPKITENDTMNFFITSNNLSPAILAILSLNKFSTVRSKVIGNINTPLQVIEMLINDEDHFVKRNAQMEVMKRKNKRML